MVMVAMLLVEETLVVVAAGPIRMVIDIILESAQRLAAIKVIRMAARVHA